MNFINDSNRIAHNDELNIFNMDLNDYIMVRLDEFEIQHLYDVPTDTVRCWIDDFNREKLLLEE